MKPLPDLLKLQAENERLRNRLNTDSQDFTIMCLRAENKLLREALYSLRTNNTSLIEDVEKAINLYRHDMEKELQQRLLVNGGFGQHD